MFKLSESKIEDIRREVSFQYSRSSGPGGQKVNKTETRCELFWKPEDSFLFSENQKSLLAKKLSNRMNKEGFLLYASDRYRTRLQNQNMCLQNLVEDIEKSLTKPKPRKKTKPTRASVEKRIKEKKRQGDKKKQRKEGKYYG